MSRPIASADAFRAVADPTRRRMLDLLRQRQHTAGDLFEQFRLSKPAASRHLAVLRNAGLVTQQRRGRHRVYSLRPESLRVLREWLARFRQAPLA